MVQCQSCTRAWDQAYDAIRQYSAQHQPLLGIEIFSGVGGLSTGLDDSGFVKTRFAIENNSIAAQNFL